LVKSGNHVTVISSKPEKQKEIEALGATAATGSLQDVDFLVSVFTGANAVFCMIPPNFAAPDQLEYYRGISSHYSRAVRQTGVRRVVHLSSYGAHLDKGTGFILGSHAAEGILNELPGIALTHLRPGYFYNNLYNFAGMIKEQGIIGSNYGGIDKIALVDPRDIAHAAAEELQTPTGGNVRYIASDEHTASEVATILGAAIGKPDLQWLTFTNEQLQAALEKRGLSAYIAANMVALGASLHSGVLLEDYEIHKPATLGKVKLEEFAKEFAAAF
jgi:uncharacterized protein YbjT (DUF2867 family)